MTTTKRLAAVLAAASALLVTAAPARAATSGGPPAEYVSYLEMKAMDAMHLMDQGQKGYVTRDEFMRYQEQMFDRMDRNHDGKVTVEEWLGRPQRRGDRER